MNGHRWIWIAFGSGLITGAALGFTLGVVEYDARGKAAFMAQCTEVRPSYECLALWPGETAERAGRLRTLWRD